MTNLNEQISLEDLSDLQDLQRQVCDLTVIKCDGQLKVHVECQQGRHRNAVIISNPGNNRSLTLYLKPSGWQMSARKGKQTAWELSLIGPIPSVVETVESRIEAFLVARPLYQSLLFNVKHSFGQQVADKRYATH